MKTPRFATRLSQALAGLLLAALSSCAVTQPADHEYERPGPVRHGLSQEPFPSRIR